LANHRQTFRKGGLLFLVSISDTGKLKYSKDLKFRISVIYLVDNLSISHLATILRAVIVAIGERRKTLFVPTSVDQSRLGRIKSHIDNVAKGYPRHILQKLIFQCNEDVPVPTRNGEARPLFTSIYQGGAGIADFPTQEEPTLVHLCKSNCHPP
jgi:hypothetical protein